MQNQQADNNTERTGGYSLAAGVLMLSIIVMLAILWYRERSARIEAQQTISEMSTQSDRIRDLLMSVGPASIDVGGVVSPAAPVISRETLQPKVMNIAGKDYHAFNVSERAGELLGGFQKGDMIIIGPLEPSDQQQ